MKNIKKIIFGLFLFGFVFLNVEAASIKEKASDYDGDMIIIGSTRFDAETIISADVAAKAGINEARLSFAKYYEIRDIDVKVYYYNSDTNEWSKVVKKTLEDGTVVVESDYIEDSTEVKKIEDNLNIFFVENEVKKMELPFSGVVDESSKEDLEEIFGVKYDATNKKFTFDALVFNFQFTSNGATVEVVTPGTLDEDVKDEDIHFDDFEVTINPIINFVDLPKEQPTFRVNEEHEFTLNVVANSFENKKVSIKLDGIDGEHVVKYDNGTELVNLKLVEIEHEGEEYSYVERYYVLENLSLKSGEYRFITSTDTQGYGYINASILVDDEQVTYTEESYSYMVERKQPELTSNLGSENLNVGEFYEFTLNITANDYVDIPVSLNGSFNNQNGPMPLYDLERFDGTNWVSYDQFNYNIDEQNFVLQDKEFKYRVAFYSTGEYKFSSNLNGIFSDSLEKTINVVYDAETSNMEAFVSDVYYENLETAISLAPSNNEPITLLKDVDLETALEISSMVEINLNNKNLTVKNDTEGNGIFHVLEGGDLIINGEGTLDGTGNNTYSMVIFAEGGDVTLNGGTYTNTDITGSDDHYDVIYAKEDSRVVINGGRYEGKTPAWILNLKDGSAASIEVKGGEFVGFNPADNKTENPARNFVADGYKVVETDGIYEVVALEATDVAITNGFTYETLQATIDAAKIGGTVTLLQNIDSPTAVEVSKEVVVELNGKNLTVVNDTEGNGVFHVVEGGDLTINGDGIVDGTGNNTYSMVIFAEGGDVTLNGGTYTNTAITGSDDHYDVIYAKLDSKITINGGRYEGKTPAWLLNLKDANRDTASIEVKGGEFVEFNPANNSAEGQGTNFVAQGYESIDNNGVYIVQQIAE